MIELLNGVLLGGLAAVAVPIIIHFAHRRRIRPLEWGAMRFLMELLRRKRRSLSLDHLLLLLVRMLALACLALSLTRPNLSLRSGPADLDVIDRGGQKVAAVLLIDDGLSSAVGRGHPALEACQKLAAAYLDTLKTGDEVSILAMSRIGAPAADPIYDLTAALEQVAALKPTAMASDIPALFEAGLSQLGRHLNPKAELVLVTAGRDDGWHQDDRMRWNDLRQRLVGHPDAAPGSRSRPRLILLCPQATEVDSNLAVTGLAVDRSLIPAGRPVTIRATIAHFGARALPGTLVRLLVDGRAVAERSLDLVAGSQAEYAFTHSFAEAGSHIVEAVVEGARDPLPLDDRRALSVQVEAHVPALLVEGRSGQGLKGKLGLVATALDPVGDTKDLFDVTRISAAAFGERALAGVRVVVLGDLAALDVAGIAALEHFVAGGGGVLVGLGPDTNPELVNRFWARNGDGFLPCSLLTVQTPEQPLLPGSANLAHPALAAFTAKASEAWKTAQVRSYYRLDVAKVPNLIRVISLDNGDPLVVERVRGMGRVALVTTSLDNSWCDMPLRPAFVPLLRGLAASLGSIIVPPRNLTPGERLAWVLPEGVNEQGVTAEGPDGAPLPLTGDAWEGRHALVSEPLLKPGIYQLRVADPATVLRYAVAIPPSGSRLKPLADSDTKDALHALSLHRVGEPARVTALFTLGQATSVELARWLVLACVALLFLETWLTRAQASRERNVSAEARMTP